MKVTVCQLNDSEINFVADWANLKAHIYKHKPDLLLLPEMPFGKWIAAEKEVGVEVKIQSLHQHEKWIYELEQLKVRYIVYSRPVMAGDQFFNTAFVHEKNKGHRKIHSKAFFPEEDGFWEESWYDAEEPKTFEVITIGDIKIGVLLCTEMWFTQCAREYAKQGINLLLCPRATGAASVRQWIRCGQTLAVIAGAYCLSSNRGGQSDNGFKWGGKGWVAAPGDGELLGITTDDKQFLTVEVEIDKSREAKNEYPLYVKE